MLLNRRYNARRPSAMKRRLFYTVHAKELLDLTYLPEKTRRTGRGEAAEYDFGQVPWFEDMQLLTNISTLRGKSALNVLRVQRFSPELKPSESSVRIDCAHRLSQPHRVVPAISTRLL